MFQPPSCSNFAIILLSVISNAPDRFVILLNCNCLHDVIKLDLYSCRSQKCFFNVIQNLQFEPILSDSLPHLHKHSLTHFRRLLNSVMDKGGRNIKKTKQLQTLVKFSFEITNLGFLGIPHRSSRVVQVKFDYVV